MRKIAMVVLCALCLALGSTAFAGDVANFVSLGFSPDGKAFAFGQYGLLDSDYRPYADIWCVDVAANAFLKGGSFSTTATVGGKDAKSDFFALQEKAASFMKKNGIVSASPGRPLYVQGEDPVAAGPVSFRDFETGNSFSVKLVPYVETSGSKVSSSFYILLEITSPDGKSVRKTVGNPGVKRSGVQGYLIRRIVTDDSGKSIVFVVEKQLPATTGVSSRFMVETVRL